MGTVTPGKQQHLDPDEQTELNRKVTICGLCARPIKRDCWGGTIISSSNQRTTCINWHEFIEETKSRLADKAKQGRLKGKNPCRACRAKITTTPLTDARGCPKPIRKRSNFDS